MKIGLNSCRKEYFLGVLGFAGLHAKFPVKGTILGRVLQIFFVNGGVNVWKKIKKIMLRFK